MKKICIAILFLLISHSGTACDVCGCALGGNYFGLLPGLNRNFVGLRWSQAKFYAHMNHHSEYLAEEYSNDTYQKVEAWGRFGIGKRVQLFAFVPYIINGMNGSIQKVKASGLGDVVVIGNYRVLTTADEEALFQHTMLVGGGVKLPTGKFDVEDQGKLVNPNFQMGSGSVDFLVNAIYNVKYKR